MSEVHSMIEGENSFGGKKWSKKRSERGQTSGYRGKGKWEGHAGVEGKEVQTPMYKISKLQGSAVQHRQL